MLFSGFVPRDAAFGAALRRGDLVFAASPFNVNVEAVGEPSLLAGLVDVAAQLVLRLAPRLGALPPLLLAPVRRRVLLVAERLVWVCGILCSNAFVFSFVRSSGAAAHNYFSKFGQSHPN